MSLEDRLNEAQDSTRDDPQFVPRTEFDGEGGYIQTGPLGEDFDPSDTESILRLFGYDPQKVTTVGPARISKWEQRTRIRGSNEYNSVWLTAYKFTIANRGFAVDLPALYNEIRRTKAKPPAKPTGESTVVVCWADIQVGKTDHLGGLRELLDRLDSKRAALHAHLKRVKFDRIVVCDVGDIIEGFSNFPAQHRTNSLSLMDQVDVAAVEFWKTLSLCAGFAPVDVLSIPSNHCAWRREGKNAGRPTDDWGLHINQRLERHNEEAGLPLTFHRPAEWMETLQFDIRNTKLGLAHGHQASSPDQVKNWWAKMSHSGALDADVLVTGHFHFASLRPSGRNPRTGKSRWRLLDF